MNASYYIVACLLLINTNSGHKLIDNYLQKRMILIEEELEKSVGGRINLTTDEEIANTKLMKWKTEEISIMFEDPSKFNMSKHYFSYRDDIERSNVYKVLKKMPKGAVLHVHSAVMLGSDYMVRLTYADHLYVCFNEATLHFLFSETVPSRPCASKWELMSELRNATDDINLFDEQLRTYFTLNEESSEKNIDETWIHFETVYRNIKSLLKYRPIREKHFYDSLQRFYDDNIMYVEIRTGLSKLLEYDGTWHDEFELARLYRRVTEKFMEDHPDFVGVKIILTRHRSTDVDHVRESLNTARRIKAEMPEMFAGFDLVGQEDKGKPLSEFAPVLNEAREDIDYYFHGGETNWYGTSTDENLIDAILLGTKRIGHGYALMKHPHLLSVVKSKSIAVETNVISNAVLSLVSDVRNHPLSLYLAMDVPVVLSSDDPGVWDAEPLTHDFYVAFMGVASRHADLRTLKQLSLNSIEYSALDEQEKEKAFAIFHGKWANFVTDLINMDL